MQSWNKNNAVHEEKEEIRLIRAGRQVINRAEHRTGGMIHDLDDLRSRIWKVSEQTDIHVLIGTVSEINRLLAKFEKIKDEDMQDIKRLANIWKGIEELIEVAEADTSKLRFLPGKQRNVFRQLRRIEAHEKASVKEKGKLLPIIHSRLSAGKDQLVKVRLDVAEVYVGAGLHNLVNNVNLMQQTLRQVLYNIGEARTFFAAAHRLIGDIKQFFPLVERESIEIAVIEERIPAKLIPRYA